MSKKIRHGPSWLVMLAITFTILIGGCGGGSTTALDPTSQENITHGQNPFLTPLSEPTGIDTGHNDPSGLLAGEHVPEPLKGFTAATAIESVTVTNGDLVINYTSDYQAAMDKVAGDRSVSAINQLDFQFDIGEGTEQEFIAGHGEKWSYQFVNLTGFDSERPVALSVHPTTVTDQEYFVVTEDWVFGRRTAFGPFHGNANVELSADDNLLRWVSLGDEAHAPELRIYIVTKGNAGSLPAEGTVDYVNAFSPDYRHTLPPLQLAESKKLYVLINGERQSSSAASNPATLSADTPFGVPLFNQGRITSAIKTALSRFEGMVFRPVRTTSASANMEGDEAGEVEMNWEFPNENDPVWQSLAITSIPVRIQSGNNLIIGQADPPTESFIDIQSNPTGDVTKPLPGDADYELTELSLAGPGETQDMGEVVVPVLPPKSLDVVYTADTTTSSLEWPACYGADGYEIWRNLDGAGFVLRATVGNVLSYDDIVGSGHFSATYKLKAKSGNLVSVSSGEETVSTVTTPQADDWATDTQIDAANGLNGALQHIDSITGIKTVILSDYDGVSCKQYQLQDGSWAEISNGSSIVSGWMDAISKHIVVDNGSFYLAGGNLTTGVHVMKSTGSAPLVWEDVTAEPTAFTAEVDIAVLNGLPAVVFETSGNDLMFTMADAEDVWATPHLLYNGEAVVSVDSLNLVKGSAQQPIAVWYASDGGDSHIAASVASDSTPTVTGDWTYQVAVPNKSATFLSVSASAAGNLHLTYVTGGEKKLWYSSSAANASSWNDPLLVEEISAGSLLGANVGILSGNKAYISYLQSDGEIGLALSSTDLSADLFDWTFGSAGGGAGSLLPSVVMAGSYKGVVYQDSASAALYQR